MANDLILGSKYEQMDVIAAILAIDNAYSFHMGKYWDEAMQNFQRVAGKLYSEADLAKLSEEQRPNYVYNLLLPILLRLSGSYLDNQSRVEATPRTPGDYGTTKIMTDLLDYSHYTANNISRELGLAFIFAAIGRVGWVANEWSYRKDSDGMNHIYCDNPFTIKWDGGFTKRDLIDTPALIKTGWYNPEELITLFAKDKDDLAEEILEKSKMYLGEDAKGKLLSYSERTFGKNLAYAGEKTGFDTVTSMINNALGNNANYFDASKGAFKIIECHERKQEVIHTLYDPAQDTTFDITKAIGANGKKYDDQKLNYLVEYYGFIDPIIKSNYVEKIYQTDICPSFNMVMYKDPYIIQNKLFKYTPVFCFDFGTDSMEWKSYIDLVKDTVTSINLTQNTIQTYIMKQTHVDTRYEADAIHPDSMEEFLSNKIGKKIKLNPGKMGKVEEAVSGQIPPALVQNMQINKDMLREQTGIGQNPQGQSESSNETGVLFAQRVQQSEKMLSWVLGNAIEQQIIIGRNTKDLLRQNLTPGRMIKITGDETDPYWLEFNEQSIKKLTYNQQGQQVGEEEILGNIQENDYDIVLSKAPYGDFAKQQEFEKVMFAANFLKELDPAMIPIEEVIKAAGLRNPKAFLDKIKERQQQNAIAMQSQMEAENQKAQMEADKEAMGIKEKELSNQQKLSDLQADQMIMNAVQGVL